jgi:HK97 family phage major capsid protein
MKMREAQNKMQDLLNKAKAESRVFTAEEQSEFDKLQGEFQNAKKMADAEVQIQNQSKNFVEPAPASQTLRIDVGNCREGVKEFKNLTEQLAAIKSVAVEGRVDDRLTKVNNALGGSAGAGQDGGFLIQSDFAGAMMETAVKDDPILSLVDQYQISGNSDRVKWNDVAETSVATTVFGGVSVSWAAEAQTATATAPKIEERELALHKLLGFYYSTYELDSDSSFTNQLVTRAFNAAIRRELANCIISGNGVGKPIGILSSNGKVEVAKETNQAAASLEYKNISKMLNRIIDKTKAVWIMHPDMAELLDFLSLPIGTGGVPVYLPSAQQGTPSSLRGRPIYESDQCSAVGTAGDIICADMSQYIMAYKGGVQQDVSIHVQFLTAQNCFRFIFRANGAPKKNSTLTIKNSSNARANFVTLANR